MKEALLYTREKDRTVVLCSLPSSLSNRPWEERALWGAGESGRRLYSLVYGRMVAENVDPVEKKPFFHFLPTSRSDSISTIGCNFSCQHCQNYQISQYPHMNAGEITGSLRSPEQVVSAAEQSGCQSISYTYVEPTIFYEFAYECMELARRRGLLISLSVTAI